MQVGYYSSNALAKHMRFYQGIFEVYSLKAGQKWNYRKCKIWPWRLWGLLLLYLVDTLLCSKYYTLCFLRWSILIFSIFQRFSFIIFYSISFRLPHLLRVQLTEHHKNSVPYLVPYTAPHKGATHGTSQK